MQLTRATNLGCIALVLRYILCLCIFSSIRIIFPITWKKLICARLTRLQPLTRNSFWRKLPPGPQEFQLRLKCQITALGWGLQAALLSSDVVLPRTLHLRDIICLPNEDAPLFEIMKDFYQKGHRRDSNPGPSGWDPKPTRALTNRPLRLPLLRCHR